MEAKVKSFLHECTQHLGVYGFQLYKGRGEQCNLGCGARVAGWFSAEDKRIAVAMNNKGWLEIFVHEYSHFLQWLDQSEAESAKDDAATNIVDEWLYSYKDFPAQKLKEAFRRVRAYEKDCEIRAIKLIQTYKLPIRIKRYLKYANLCIYEYHASEKTRSKGCEFIPSSSLMRLMPSSLRRGDGCPDAVLKRLLPLYSCFD